MKEQFIEVFYKFNIGPQMFSFKGKGPKPQVEENRIHSHPTMSLNVKSLFPKGEKKSLEAKMLLKIRYS